MSSQNSKQDSSISTIIVDGNTITDPTEMAENFKKKFHVNRKKSPNKDPSY